MGFSVLRFWLFFRSVFRFLLQKTSVFRFWWTLRFADFSFCSIWFSVFVKNTSGFSVLVPDVVFGFSYFVLFWVPVSVRFEQHLISNTRETPKLFRGMRGRINVMVGETTMAKHGTLPEYLYQRHLEVGDKVNLNFGVDEDEGPYEDLNEREVSEEASVSSEGQQEFDESSDEEVEVSRI